jgi:AbrB family looped-hinge helix DNA binding protein
MKIYNKGQVIIPVNIRKKFNFNIGDYVEVIITEDGIKLIPAKKRKTVDRLYGVLNKNAGLQSISENDINKVSEAEFLKGWDNK